ncbi:MAG: apolipoprotein N-acyltransferase [Micrococcales bacterium]|nr:MAG: apolipoprotein N-acyltransferase [Micrococcales bacterium]PIE27412.1 MAG: apolipoprotein N-acyltransferase [Micrococcales bacterium]
MRILAAFAAAGSLILAFPGIGLWPAAPIGVALLILAVHDVPGTRRRVLLTGAVVGAVAGFLEHWFVVGWTGAYLGWLPRFAVAALMASYYALTGAGLAMVGRLGRPVPRAVAAAAVWALGEWVMATFPYGGFGWTRLAFSQAGSPFVDLAALGGVPLVGFAVALTGALLAESAGSVLGRRAEPGRRSTGRWPAVVPVVAAGVVSMTGLAVPGPPPAQETMNVLGVQGNVPRAGLEFNAQRRAVLDNHARLTHQAAGQIRAGERPRPDLVVWPENASDIDPFVNPDARRVIAAAVVAVDTPTLLGTLVRTAAGTANTTLLWEPAGAADAAVVDRYVKQLPVPFVEYVPHRRFYTRVSSMLELAGQFVPGTRPGVFDVGAAPVGDLICFEIIDDDVVRATASRTQLMVLQTNNATFGYTAESAQQLAATRVRAREHGRSFVHVSTVGISALVTPDGRAHQLTDLYTAAILQADLPRHVHQTPATRYGGAVQWALVISGMLGVLGAARWGWRRPEASSRTQTETAPVAARGAADR